MTTPTRCEHDAPDWSCRICAGWGSDTYTAAGYVAVCTCPTNWNGVITPTRFCRVHNPLNPDPLRPPETDDRGLWLAWVILMVALLVGFVIGRLSA